MKPQRRKDRHTGKGQTKASGSSSAAQSERAATDRTQAQEIERLRALVSERDEKIRQDAELIVRVRTAEQEAEELRESLRIEKELRIKALARKAPKDSKFSKKVRDLKAALLKAQKDAAAKPTTVSAEVVRDLQQSREELRRGAGRLRRQLETVAGERDGARLERDKAVESERRLSATLTAVRNELLERIEGEKLAAAAEPDAAAAAVPADAFADAAAAVPVVEADGGGTDGEAT